MWPQIAAYTPQIAAYTPRIAAYTPQIAAYTPQIAAYIPQIAAYIPQIAAYIPQIAAYIPKIAAYTPQIAAYTPQIAAYTPQIAAYTPQIAAYIPQIAAYTPQIAAYTPQIAAYILQIAAYTFRVVFIASTHIILSSKSILVMKPKKAFNFLEDALYEICANAWMLCETRLAEFADYSTKYDSNYIQLHLQRVAAAKALDGPQERTSTPQAARENLLLEVPKLMNLYNKLIGYIGHSYSPAEARAYTEGTRGLADMERLRNGDWLSISSLITASQSFINDNQAILLANAGMNPNFPTAFQAQAQKMQDLQNMIVFGDSNALLGTQNKREANNIIYGHLQRLFKDAKAVYMPSDTMAKQFTLAYQKRKAIGVKAAGIQAKVKDAADGKFILGATIRIIDPNNPKSATTDKLGGCKILQVATGKYDIECTAAGYQTKILTQFTIKVGTVSWTRFELEKIATV